MTWLTPEGEYLVQGTGAVLPDWSESVRDPAGEPVRPARFHLVTPGGEVRRAFSEPIGYAIDDERGLANVHAVSGDTLVGYHIFEHRSFGLRVEPRVEITGLTPVEAARVPPGLSAAIATYEERERLEQDRRAEASRRGWEALREALDQLRNALSKETGRVEATWQFEPGGWVVRRGDGSVLARGPLWGYGRDVYRNVEAVLRERLGDRFNLALRLGPGEEAAFYPD